MRERVFVDVCSKLTERVAVFEDAAECDAPDVMDTLVKICPELRV